MNYIKHLTGFFEKIQYDRAISSSQLAIYMALFQCWNKQRFQNPMVIIRDEVMRLSKITSRGTYHRSMKLLHDLGYIRYYPSHSPHYGSEVYMFPLDDPKKLVTSLVVEEDQTEPWLSSCSKDEQVNTTVIDPLMEPIIKHKLKLKPNVMDHTSPSSTGKDSDSSIPKVRSRERWVAPTLEEVNAYFEQKNANAEEGAKFFYYFESNGWLVGGKAKMKNWQAAANHWLLKSRQYASGRGMGSTAQRPLDTSWNKRYDEPL